MSENECISLYVGEEAGEVESEDDSNGDLVATHFGEVGGDCEEVDKRRSRDACWACNAMYCCNITAYIYRRLTSAVSY